MTRYVVLHKLKRGFEKWEFHGSYDSKQREISPQMTEEFNQWYQDNSTQIKKVHWERMVEFDHTQIALEFHKEEDALLCMLQFG